MKKLTILGIISLLLVVYGYYIIFSPSSDTPKMVLEHSNVEVVGAVDSEIVLVEPRKGTGTLESLRVLNEDLECAISYTPRNLVTEVEGTFFVSDGNIRGDFLTESPDLSGRILSSMIIKDTTMYTWSEIEGEAYGMKIDLTTTEAEAAETKQPVSLSADVKYDCKNWENVDRTVFVPPSDVLFQDMSELMKAGMEEAIIYEEGEGVPF